MARPPLVTAVIPTYNRARLVCDAIDSILGQTYKPIEIVVVDDGSTDDTLLSLKRYGDSIRVLQQENAGPAAARNRGIAVARGDVVAFLDSDDLWLPTKVERQMALLDKLGPTVPCCLCNIRMHWRDRQITSFESAWLNSEEDEGLWSNVAEVLATRFVLFNQGIVIRRSVLDRIGGFDKRLYLLEDVELALRLSLEGPWGYIREPLVTWRESEESCYQTARDDELKALRPLPAILQDQLGRIAVTGYGGTPLQQSLQRELRRAQRRLHAAKLASRPSIAASSLGRVLTTIEQYRNGFFRRSSGFPKVKVQPLASFSPAHFRESQDSLSPSQTR